MVASYDHIHTHKTTNNVLRRKGVTSSGTPHTYSGKAEREDRLVGAIETDKTPQLARDEFGLTFSGIIP